MKITKKLWLRIHEVARKRNIDPDQLSHMNCVRPHGKKESKDHWNWKCNKCRELYEINHPYISECFALNRKRKYDVIDLLDDIVFEGETNHKINKDGAETIRIKR